MSIRLVKSHDFPGRRVRVSTCGRVSLELLKEGYSENPKRVYKWSFDFPPFMGTKFDFIAYHRPAPSYAYNRTQRVKARVRARSLFDALDDGIGAEVGLMRKPKRNAWKYKKPTRRAGQGATAYELREALQHRHGLDGATNICKTIHPNTAYANLNADALFECIYAERWAGAYGRSLRDWKGMSTEVSV